MVARACSPSRRPGCAARSPLLFAAVLATSLLACTTMRGRADAALERGDYREAVELYTKLLARKPGDAALSARLTAAERGLLDQALGRAESERRAGNAPGALRAGLEALEAKDRIRGESIDPQLRERLTALVDWATGAIVKPIEAETERGRALAARARRVSMTRWLDRPELASVGPQIDQAIASAGAKTCARATADAQEQPFTLELVAAYCETMGAPLPPWRPRPLLVGAAALSGTITGTPTNEQVELARAVESALARSVWYTPSSNARAAVRLQGSVTAVFTREPTELTRSWTERVPYEATEAYTEAVKVPYEEEERYTESVPYTAFEDKYEPCPPPQTGSCRVSRPVTRHRDETRYRTVTRYRTEHQERTRTVTRFRDEPRVFQFAATKHDGRYQHAFDVQVELDGTLRPIVARGSAEESRVSYEHAAEFAPAGVYPEQNTLPSAPAWRQKQRDALSTKLLAALESGWVDAFCSEAISTIEEAARCARARPEPAPRAVIERIGAFFGDDPERVLALPRPREGVR